MEVDTGHSPTVCEAEVSVLATASISRVYWHYRIRDQLCKKQCL